jgi:DNA-binding LytR/AlgR family response regulator
MRIDCIIIEDEPLAQERIRGYIQRLPYMHLLATFGSGIEAMAFLQGSKPDLIFLDINMSDLSGIQLLESIKITSRVIISTAYHEYALRGYELNVTDYLLKPYSFERFLQAVDKVAAQGQGRKTVTQKNFLFVRTEYRLEKLQLDELLYIEGMRDYRRIHAVNKKIMTLQTFGELEQAIPASIACRVHKSFMVALEKIDAVEKDFVRVAERDIPVSETYRKQLMQLLLG